MLGIKTLPFSSGKEKKELATGCDLGISVANIFFSSYLEP